jgi:hypothetical protein
VRGRKLRRKFVGKRKNALRRILYRNKQSMRTDAEKTGCKGMLLFG